MLRREILNKHPLCQRCEKEGYITPACEVHHVRPVEEALTYKEKERLMFDPNNLRALCHACHVRTHTELGRCSKESNVKRQKDKALDFVNKFLT